MQDVNVPSHASAVDGPKERGAQRALLKALPRKAPGLTQAEMAEAVLPRLSPALFPSGAKAMWWAKRVQLDLEAKGLVVRDAGKPLRWRRT